MINRVINGICNRISRVTPDNLSSLLVNVPFEFRYGNVYLATRKRIIESKSRNIKDLESYVVTNFDRIFQYSKRLNFYKNKYKKSGVFDLKVRSIADISKIPLLSKEELRDELSSFSGFFMGKTGGTTGQPLQLYLDKNAWSREWAHYHYIWRKVGYKYSCPKFQFREGKAKTDFLTYHYDQNTYEVNVYEMHKIDQEIINTFFEILVKRKVKYFHGWPSAIYDFLKAIENRISNQQKEQLKKQIRCCFFASEMPLQHVIDYIRDVWNLDFIATYGHTEMCVLSSSRKNRLKYYPYHTYGYVEVENSRLIGTSYHNLDMPLIRYDTGDIVEAKKFSNKILKSFRIHRGRNFNYAIDKNGFRVSVINIIEQLKPKIWNYINYAQVYQNDNEKGKVTIIVSSKVKFELKAKDFVENDMFDFDFDFIQVREPIRAASGKVPLRVKYLPN